MANFYSIYDAFCDSSEKAAMESCIQDPVFHGEGDVWTHTKNVLTWLNIWNAEETLLLAGLFHDIAKPQTREEIWDDDLGRIRVTHRSHSRIGAQMAWVYMWKAGVPLKVRLQVYSLILWHQRAFHIFEGPNPNEEIAKFSVDGNFGDLYLLAMADNYGRISDNRKETRLTLDCLAEMARELDCLQSPYPFVNSTHKVEVCRQGKPLSYFPYEDIQRPTAWLMSGLPGSGKDTYVKKNFSPDTHQIISLDDIRKELGVDPRGNQGTVIQVALKRAKECLAAKKDLVWNATNITKANRDKMISLFRSYDACVNIVAFDVSYEENMKRNLKRKSAVPPEAMEKMIASWQPPLQSEANDVYWVK